jgi:hypothetical protein
MLYDKTGGKGDVGAIGGTSAIGETAATGELVNLRNWCYTPKQPEKPVQ